MAVRINTVTYIKCPINAVLNTPSLSKGAWVSSEAMAYHTVVPAVDSSQSMPGSLISEGAGITPSRK